MRQKALSKFDSEVGTVGGDHVHAGPRMAVVPIDSSQKKAVLEGDYDALASSMWSTKVMTELTTRGLLDPEQRREMDTEGRKVLDFLLVSSDGVACNKFCQSIASSDCGESLAKQLQESEFRLWGRGEGNGLKEFV